MWLRLLTKLVGCTGSKSISRGEVACLVDGLDVGGEEEEQGSWVSVLSSSVKWLGHFLGGEAIWAVLLWKVSVFFGFKSDLSSIG